MSDEVSNAIAALAFGLAHPLRVRLIRALEKERGSAKSFSRQFGDVELGDCSYHLNVLKRLGFIELYDNRPARGATERIFQLVPRREWARLWPRVSTSAIGTLRSGLLRQLVVSILEEADSVALDDHGEVGGVARQTVDLQGLQEIAGVVEGVRSAVERIATESRARIEADSPSGGIEVLVGIASVPIAKPFPPPDEDTPDLGQA